MEASHGGSQCLKLGLATWDVSWCLDPVHETLLIILDTRSPELALGHTTIRVSHIHLPARRHKVLDILTILVFLLFLGPFLSPLGWHIVRDVDVWLHLLLSLAILVALGDFAVGLLGNCLVVLIIIETLVRDVVISGSVFHGAVNRSVTIFFIILISHRFHHLVGVLTLGIVVVGVAITDVTRLVLFNFVHQTGQARATICLENLHTEDLRDIAIGREHILVKHAFAVFVNNITNRVDKVTAWIN